MTTHLLKITAAFFLVFCFSSNAQAVEKEAYFTLDVPPKEFKAARLRNLPLGADIGVAVESSHAVTIAFVDTADYLKLPLPKNPVMVGKVDRSLQFSVTIPADGDYYVVLVNPDVRSTAEVKVTVTASRGDAAAPVDRANRILRLFERKMHKLFVFDSFTIGAERCGRTLAFYGLGGFTLCTEYVQAIGAAVQDRKMARNILSFSIFHELGLELMEQWGMLGPSMRQRADELAAVIMIMLDQEKNMKDLGEYVLSHPERMDRVRADLIDRWHPISTQRAEELLEWTEDPAVARSWQKSLVPHMQTKLLRWLEKNPTAWSDTKLVKAELARRNSGTEPAVKSEPGESAAL